MTTEEKSESINVGGRDFEIKGILGKGGFSTVLKAVDKQTKKKVALKLTYTDAYKNKMQKQVSMHQIHKEIKVMRSLQEPNIIRLLGYDLKSTYGNRTCIVMVQELAPRRELFEYLMHSGTFQDKLARSVFKQLLTGLNVLHSKGITHRDLKPENLLFDSQFTLKIADFGFATAFEKSGQSKIVKTVLGTRGYMAPEIANSQPYTEKVDVFATGVILFILMSGFPPFRETRSSDWWWNKLAQGKTQLFWLAHERKAPQFKEDVPVKELITKMIAQDPNSRPSVAEIINDPWTTGSSLDKATFQKEMKKRLELVNRARLDKQQKKDVLADHVRNLLEGVPEGELLGVRPLITNKIRQDFAEAANAQEVQKTLHTLSKVNNFFAGLVGDFQWKEGKDVVEAANALGEASEVEDILDIAQLDEGQAKKLFNCISEIGLQYKNYDHGNTQTYLELDSLVPPSLPENHNALGMYEVKCNFGMVCLSLDLFADRKAAELEVDDEQCKATVTVKFEETETFPLNDSGTEFETQVMKTQLVIEVAFYSLENSPNKAVVFNNVTAGTNKYVTHSVYSQMVTEIITETGIAACYVGKKDEENEEEKAN